MRAMTVEDVMTRKVVSVRPETPYKEIVDRIVADGISAVAVVTGDGTLLGVLSRSDLLRGFLRGDEEIRAEIEREVLGKRLAVDRARVRVSVEHGVVLLTGRVEFQTDVDTLVRGVRAIPGVVAVHNRLTFFWNGDLHGNRHGR